MSVPRNCGEEFKDDEMAYTKLELINMAMKKGLVKSIPIGRSYTLDELCIMNGFKEGTFEPKEQHKKVVDYVKVLQKKEASNIRISQSIVEPECSRLNVDRKCMIPFNSDITLREHQQKVVDHMLTHRGLLAIHSTGTGKTLTAVSAMNCILDAYPDIKVYVVTPKSLKQNFKKEIKKFGLELRGKHKDKKGRIEVLTYESFVQRIIKSDTSCIKNDDIDPECLAEDDDIDDIEASKKIDCSNSFIIIDEVHNLKAEFKKSQSGDNITGKRAFVISNCVAAAKKVLLLSATPVMNNPGEIINYISMITRVPLDKSITTKQFLQDIIPNEKLFKDYFKCKISMNLKEKDENYPKRIDEPIIKFVMDPEFYNKYLDMELKKFDQFGGKFSSNVFQNAVRRASVALDGEDSPKIKWTIDFIKKEVEAKRKTVVFSQFKEFGLEALRKHLDKEEIRYGLITGDIPEDFRKKFVKKFNKDKIYVLLISKAGGEGLDLKSTRNVVLLESNWNDKIDEQIIGRAIRFQSHNELPPDQRDVRIFRLWMVKPEKLSPIDMLPKAIDETLYLLSYDVKQKAIAEFLKRLETVSIENTPCSCLISDKPDKDKKEGKRGKQGQVGSEQTTDEKQQVGEEQHVDEGDKKESEPIINPEFYAEIFSDERESKEEAVEQQPEEEEKKTEHVYLAPGKTSLAIEDIEMTKKQYKKITGVISEEEYEKYKEEYYKNLESKEGYIMKGGKKVRVVEKRYKTEIATQLKDEDKNDIDNLFGDEE